MTLAYCRNNDQATFHRIFLPLRLEWFGRILGATVSSAGLELVIYGLWASEAHLPIRQVMGM
jgi:hypothetical protein